MPGGNTANMLAIWRVHGFDRIVREAWEQGVVLYGWSAGMISWFEQGVTDSFGPQLEGMGLPRLPARQRVPALRRRGAPPAALPGARRRRLSTGLGGRRRSRAPLRRNGAGRGGHDPTGGSGLPRRARVGDAGRGAAALGGLAARGEPAGDPDPDPDRRQQRRRRATIATASDSPPDRPVAERHRALHAQVSAHVVTGSASRRRCSTVRITRCAVSSIESSETSITGQPSRRWIASACCELLVDLRELGVAAAPAPRSCARAPADLARAGLHRSSGRRPSPG